MDVLITIAKMPTIKDVAASIPKIQIKRVTVKKFVGGRRPYVFGKSKVDEKMKDCGCHFEAYT